MNDILKNYTQEEIEELALKSLETEATETTLQITKIDKDYKKHNQQAVTRAIMNGATILVCASIVLSSDSNLSSFGTEDLANLFHQITEIASYLPKSDILVAVYTKLFDGVSAIIDKIGLVGILLACKSINFILTSVKDIKKTFIMKEELKELKQKLEQQENYKK